MAYRIRPSVRRAYSLSGTTGINAVPENSSDLLAKMANTLEMALCYSPLAKSLAKVLDRAESLEYRARVLNVCCRMLT